MDYRVAAPLGEELESLFAERGVVAAVLGEFLPELLAEKISEATVAQERCRVVQSSESADFGEEPGARLDGRDATRQSVAARFDA